MAAPVCSIAPTTPSPSNTTITIPSIPVPTSDNVQAVLSALRQAVLSLTNQISQLPSTTRVSGQTPANPPSQKQSSFRTVNQVVNNVKVLDPNDPTGSTFVTVAQVTSLTLENPVTGESWVWNAPGSIPG